MVIVPPDAKRPASPKPAGEDWVKVVDPRAFNMKPSMTLHIGRSNEKLARVQRAYQAFLPFRFLFGFDADATGRAVLAFSRCSRS
jgi:hypothetical protein